MAWDLALQGIGAGLGGALDAYTWQQEHALKKQTATDRSDIERLKLELREMLAQLAEDGKNTRHTTPSGSVIAQQSGATARTKMTQEGANARAKMTEDGRNARWKEPSGNAKLGAETTRRGQDITAVTQRRGQDISATTQRRGQDLNVDTNRDRNRATLRGQDLNFGARLAEEAGRQQRHTSPSGSSLFRSSSTSPYGPSPITSGRKTMDMQPGDQPAPATPPNNPSTQSAPQPMASVDPQLAEQVKNLTAQFDNSTDPDERAAIQYEMRRILQVLKGGQ